MIDFTLKSKKIKELLQDIEKRSIDLTPAFEEIGNIIVESVEDNFQDEGRHNGDPTSIMGGSQKWEKWSDEWQKRRNKLGKGDGKILQLDGGLASSIDYDANKDSVIITAGKEYAYRQHFGGNGIPARPFLVIQEEDLDDIIEELNNFIISGY